MSKPTTKAIRLHLERRKVKATDADKWARFLTGLDWDIIKPLVQIALNSKVHPALAADMVARTTRDEQIKATLQTHLEAKAPSTSE